MYTSTGYLSFLLVLISGSMILTSDQELIHVTQLVVLVWMRLFEKAQGYVVSNGIGLKFRRIVLQINMHRLTSRISDMT